ncbi:unnamed protein product [Trifolium pratense]|uniref:Uncharacterized protein n=1 Tax=Trifolium pratense TaxID=57577 RepID=A0ACB0JQ58_TRIPR|nr:unnamed protein product [Trifolium pratense]
MVHSLLFKVCLSGLDELRGRIHLLWGEKDKIFKLEVAHNIKEKLGNNATIEVIKKAGHLVNMERPFIYNRCLKKFLSSIMMK